MTVDTVYSMISYEPEVVILTQSGIQNTQSKK